MSERQRLEALQTLRAKYPQDFTVTPAQARDRRHGTCCSMAVRREVSRRAGSQCLKDGNLGAAQFHYHWLIAEMVLNAAAEKKK